MTRFGYTLMTEQSGPRPLVRYAKSAERAGFDFLVSSDHYFPWLESMGHSPYAWAVLGAVAEVTEQVELLTYVTCPTMRYHPAVVAQKAATVGLLSEGRFTLGLGSGENLNEHVVGQGWPAVAARQEMLEEAVTIIRRLLGGELLTVEGDYFRVDQARLWDRPDPAVEIGIAVGGEEAVRRFATLADHLIATEPSAELVSDWGRARREAGLGPSRAIGQVPICWGRTRTPRSTVPTSCSGGSVAAGRSTPTCRCPPDSRAPLSSSAPRTSARRSPADPTSTSWPTRCGPSGRPGSPTSPWFRSGMRASGASSTTAHPSS